ncbi:MAG TPA: M23 family metallopeptidase [Vicinamibacterales bacterium]|nr:M23 family metallopeptidase [Vicinamibacterales bacterium]
MSGPTAPSSASAACTPHPASANAVLPVFGRPFDGAFPIGNFFDHDKPIEGDANGYVLTLCGARDTSQVDGHPGYDWRMPEGTPLLAVADAVVIAGLEAPNFCPQLNRTVQALLVVLIHTAPTGELYASIYGHLSRIDVQAGASVSEGTVIGLSGNTGCSGTPHPHFGVGRSVAGRYVLIDPYGWHAPMGDPRGSSTRAARRACGFGKTERRHLFDNGAEAVEQPRRHLHIADTVALRRRDMAVLLAALDPQLARA